MANEYITSGTVGIGIACLAAFALFVVAVGFFAACGAQLSYKLGDALRSWREARVLNKEYRLLCEDEKENA